VSDIISKRQIVSVYATNVQIFHTERQVMFRDSRHFSHHAERWTKSSVSRCKYTVHSRSTNTLPNKVMYIAKF